jgi:hypothetical protein
VAIPAASPAPADWHHEHLEIGVLLEQLECHGALPGDHPRIVERVNESVTLFLLQFGGALERVIVAVAVQDHLGAVLFGAALLGDRGGLRHDDRRMDAVALGRKGEPLRVIARGGCDHAGFLVGIVEAQYRVHRAAVLVGAGALKVLHLQMKFALTSSAQRRRQNARRQVRVIANRAPRAFYVIQGNRNRGSHLRSPLVPQQRCFRFSIDLPLGQPFLGRSETLT